MIEATPPRWLEWAHQIQSISQTGLTYSDNEYDTERYQRLMQIAAAIVHSHTALPPQLVLQDFLAQPGYATPKVDVRGAVVRQGRILLVQERADRRWCLPGGWAEVGDLPSQVVVREVAEESGFRVMPRKVIGVFDANRSPPLELYHAYKIVFLCDITSGQAQPSQETLAVGFFRFDDLPPLSAHRTDERHLAEVLAHLQDQRRPAAFD